MGSPSLYPAKRFKQPSPSGQRHVFTIAPRQGRMTTVPPSYTSISAYSAQAIGHQGGPSVLIPSRHRLPGKPRSGVLRRVVVFSSAGCVRVADRTRVLALFTAPACDIFRRLGASRLRADRLRLLVCRQLPSQGTAGKCYAAFGGKRRPCSIANHLPCVRGSDHGHPSRAPSPTRQPWRGDAPFAAQHDRKRGNLPEAARSPAITREPPW